MTIPVTLFAEHGTMRIDADGVLLKPRFSSKFVSIPWKSISFFSPTPAVRHKEHAWETYDGKSIDAISIANGLPFYCFHIAIKDINPITARLGFLQRKLFMRAFWPRPLDETEHFISIYLRVRWLRKNGQHLVQALDLISQYSRFDIICFFDY